MRSRGLGAAVLACLSGMMLSTVEAAPARRERVVKLQYLGGGAGIAQDGTGSGFCSVDAYDPEEICVAVDPRLGERFVHVEFIDAAGQKVAAEMMQGGAEAESYTNVGPPFCGSHKSPVKLVSSVQPLQINFYNGTCKNGEPSIVTSGYIVVTFSTVP